MAVELVECNKELGEAEHAKLNEYLLSIGKAIVYNRKKIRKSQKDLASEIGVKASHLSRIEVGKANITVKTLFKIACALNVSITELLSMVDSHEKNIEKQQLGLILERITNLEETVARLGGGVQRLSSSL